MSHMPEHPELAGVRFYPSDSDPETFFFLPDAPEPQRDPQGRPSLTLWVDNAGARLQLGGRWDVAPDRLAALKRELLRRQPELSPALVRLAPAPLSQVAAELALGDGEQAPVSLARVPSSGFAPYQTLFNVTLDATQREQALAALHGRTGFLTLAYRGMLAGSATATVTISGDVVEDLEMLPDRPSIEACRAQVGVAIDAGRLRVERVGGADASAELWRRAEEQARAQAATELRRLHAGAPRQPVLGSGLLSTEAHLQAEASLSERADQPYTARVDIADWFVGGVGALHVRNTSGGVTGTPPPADTERPPPPGGSTAVATVALGFAPAELPVAFVRLRRGAWSGTLRGPAFAAVELPAGAGPLEVTTNYTSGAPYSVALAAPGAAGWQLSPADLGLAEVTVDATARRDAGAREVRLRLRYSAAGAGNDDDRTVYLRRDTWTAHWFLITRAPSLDGALELEWREIGANGAPAWQRPAPIETTTITL